MDPVVVENDLQTFEAPAMMSLGDFEQSQVDIGDL
jgi:hypothetical protein